MNSLNQLFEEILHSEKSFNDQITYLKELNGKIEAAQRELITSKNTTEALRGQLVVKTQRLVDVKVDLQLAKTKANVLQGQKEKLEQDNVKLKKELDGLISDNENRRIEFMNQLASFNKSYDLKGSGMKFREQQARKRIEELNNEIDMLEKEFVDFECKQIELCEAEKTLQDEENKLKIITDNNNKLQAEIESVRKTKEQLEHEKSLLTDKLHEDPDIKKLRSELDICCNSPEEQQCHVLKEELEKLQRDCYKKQMKFVRQPQPLPPPPPPLLSNSNNNEVIIVNNSSSNDSSIEAIDNDWELDESEIASLEAFDDMNEFDFDYDEFTTQEQLPRASRGSSTRLYPSKIVQPVHSHSYSASDNGRQLKQPFPGRSIYKASNSKLKNKKVRFS